MGRYGLCITEALMKLRPADKFTLFSFLRPGRKLVHDFELANNAAIKYIRWFPGRGFSLLMRSGIALPLELFGLMRADVLFFPNFIAWSSVLGKKRVSVVHDIAFEFYPEFIQHKNLAYLQKQARKSVKRSTKVVAVSEATKQDLIRHYGTPANKIVVVPNAVDHTIFNPKAGERTAAVLKKHRIPEKYLMFLGNIEPRKNLIGLLKAYSQSYPAHRAALVIVGGGKWTWNDTDYLEQIKNLADLPIIRTGFINDADASALYAGAEAFVYPSFYEGFGIPCLEAMACGCPVVCSNLSSFPELVGNAALQVDPRDIDDIKTAILKITGDAALRRRLIAAGQKRAAKYNWKNSAMLLSKALDEVI